MFIRKFVAVALVALVIATVAACSSDEGSSDNAQTSPNPTAEGVSDGVEKSTATPSQPTTTPQENVPVAPVFSVAGVDGEDVKFEELLGKVPIYLLFIPSTTDDLDRDQLSLIQANMDIFESHNAKVIVVVSDLPTEVIEMRDELGLDFALISDPLHVLANDWQVFDLDNEGKVSPASFVFDAFGGLAARSVATTPKDRPTVEEVLYIIEESLNSAAA
jgi:peroxiredoxin